MPQPALKSLTVSGFRAIGSPQTVEIRPLTILAGANNTGKSSIVQPLLLLKQTLLSPFEPGGFRLEGPLVTLSHADCRHRKGGRTVKTPIEFRFGFGDRGLAEYVMGEDRLGQIAQVAVGSGRDRIAYAADSRGVVLDHGLPRRRAGSPGRPSVVELFATVLRRAVHLRSSRTWTGALVGHGNGLPESTENSFEDYVARVIRYWQAEDQAKLQELQSAIGFLNVTARYDEWAESVLFSSGDSEPGHYRLNLMGYGTSQAFPVVVALVFAEPGDLVHVEEPEANLHPRAQIGLARVMVQAAKRGVRVMIETHSSLILREIQTQVRGGELDARDVKLHWFQWNRREVEVKAADLDADGTFGDWPEDFDDVNFDSERRFLDRQPA